MSDRPWAVNIQQVILLSLEKTELAGLAETQANRFHPDDIATSSDPRVIKELVEMTGRTIHLYHPHNRMAYATFWNKGSPPIHVICTNFCTHARESLPAKERAIVSELIERYRDAQAQLERDNEALVRAQDARDRQEARAQEARAQEARDVELAHQLFADVNGYHHHTRQQRR
jgi:hypothetical protein